MAFEDVPLDNAEFAVMVGCAEPGRVGFDSGEFKGTEMDNGKLDGAVPSNTPVEANAICVVKEVESPGAVCLVVG